MKRFLQWITHLSSSRKGAWITLGIWILVAVLISGVAKTAKTYSTNGGSGLPNDAASMIAEQNLDQYFQDDRGLPALLVFHRDSKLTENDFSTIGKVTQEIQNQELETIKEVLPFAKLPMTVKQSLLSEDQTTLLVPVMLKTDLEMDEINETVTKINDVSKPLLQNSLELKITGPAGIASDTIAIFSNADIVLLLSTIGLILVLLIIIYRSPLLAIIPLLAAGIVYQVVDRTLGFFGKLGLEIESQSLSIMSILLFAALTDYALFIFSRFKEELKKEENKYTAMRKAMDQVGEPILFSASTVLAAMLILFSAVYKPYQNFAPVFSIAMVIILLAGVTLIPALFALFGRKAFWPSIPRTGQAEQETKSIWWKLARLVTKKPGILGTSVFILLLIGTFYFTTIQFSFNVINSFPKDMQSRQGYELLEEKFSKGDLAPTTVIVKSKSEAFTNEQLDQVRNQLLKQSGVEKVTPEFTQKQPQAPSHPNKSGNSSTTDNNKAEDGKVAKLSLTFKQSPYDLTSIQQLDDIRAKSKQIIKDSGLNENEVEIHFAGETAKQADIREFNVRDTWVVVILVTLLITLLLGFQTRSVIAPLYMIGTILLSYGASMGISLWIINQWMDITAISYRIPLYTFVFLVALGVDYNIMLMSRIKEEVANSSLEEAVQRGVAMTGGVISSAGLILAATFAVLMTQPILELFLFGFTVALGILIDTFLVRTLLVPSIMLKLGKWSLWPMKINKTKD